MQAGRETFELAGLHGKLVSNWQKFVNGLAQESGMGEEALGNGNGWPHQVAKIWFPQSCSITGRYGRLFCTPRCGTCSHPEQVKELFEGLIDARNDFFHGREDCVDTEKAKAFIAKALRDLPRIADSLAASVARYSSSE